MQLFHRECKTPVNLDLSNLILFSANYGITPKGLKISSGNIIIKEGKIEPSFLCGACKNNVDVENLFSFCMNCGRELPVSRLYKPSHSNGIYCEECGNVFSSQGESLILLTKILRTVIIK